jgi:hypothetical protein
MKYQGYKHTIDDTTGIDITMDDSVSDEALSILYQVIYHTILTW